MQSVAALGGVFGARGVDEGVVGGVGEEGVGQVAEEEFEERGDGGDVVEEVFGVAEVEAVRLC